MSNTAGGEAENAALLCSLCTLFPCRYPILGEFMGYVAGGEVVNAAPPVFCAYMGVLAALATTEAGAQVGL